MTRIHKILLLSGILAAAGVANATDISVNGRVVSNPCVIDDESVKKVVDFGRVNIANMVLESGEKVSAWQDFSLKLKECPAINKNVTVTFTGTADPDNGSYYKNEGTATGVAIHMTGADHSTVYATGSKLKVAVAADRTVEFPLAARVVVTKSSATAGDLHGVVEFAMTYE